MREDVVVSILHQTISTLYLKPALSVASHGEAGEEYLHSFWSHYAGQRPIIMIGFLRSRKAGNVG